MDLDDPTGGIVTRVVQREKDAQRVDVWLDDALAFDLSANVAIEAGLHPGMALSQETRIALIARDAFIRARDAGLRYLSDRARTITEVRRSLSRRGFDAEVIDNVIEYVKSHGYVDDAEYARAYVRSRFSGRGHGPARLRAELLGRGVDRAVVDEAIAEMADEADIAGAVVRLAETRWRALGDIGDPRRRRQRTLEYLVRRGYSFDEARDAVERIARGEDDNDAE